MCEVVEGTSSDNSDQRLIFKLTLAEVRRLRKALFDVRYEIARMDDGWKTRVDKILETGMKS